MKIDATMLQRLVERARNGDADAFAEIYKLLSPYMFYTAYKMVKSEHDAKDIVQEATIRLHGTLGSLRDPQNLMAYANKITYNLCLAFMNKRPLAEVENESDYMYDNIQEENAEFIPEEYVASHERRKYLLQMVDELSLHQRTVIVLFYYQELSVRQIAEILGVDSAAVKNRLSRARAALKKKIDEYVKQGVLSVSVPVLTRILQNDADSVYTAELSMQMWQNVGKTLGYSSVVLASTSAVVGGGATATTAATAATTIPTAASTVFSVKTIIGIVTTVAVASVTVIGVVTHLPDINSPIQEEYIFPQSSYTVPAAEVNSTEPRQEQQQETLPLPEGSRASDQPAQGGATTPPDTPAASPPAPEESSEASSEIFAGRLIAQNDTLRYPVGKVVSPQKIIADAGVSTVDGSPLPELEVVFYEDIQFDTPNNTGVYIEPVGSEKGMEERKAIIIIIE